MLWKPVGTRLVAAMDGALERARSMLAGGPRELSRPGRRLQWIACLPTRVARENRKEECRLPVVGAPPKDAGRGCIRRGRACADGCEENDSESGGGVGEEGVESEYISGRLSVLALGAEADS